MNVTVQKADLLPVLSRIQGIVGRKTNLAITTNVLIRTSEGGITIAATDLETGFEGHYPATVRREGTIAINARKLFEIVRDFPSTEIILKELDNHWVEIGNETVEYHIVGVNHDDFPEVPRIETADFVDIDSSVLSDMISKSVIIAAATDDRRTHIIGVLAEWVEDKGVKALRMVSTDGSRLSKVDHVFEDGSKAPSGGKALVPKKSLTEVSKFLEPEGTVRIAFKDNYLIVKKERETIIIRLLEGEFPKYQDIIVKPAAQNLFIDRQLFVMMLKRMSILSSDEYKGVIFTFGEDKLNISSTNPEIGESKEDMAIEYKGNNIKVMFNPKFFIDTMNVINDERVNLNIVSEDRPCLISGEKDDHYLSVIMPMRI